MTLVRQLAGLQPRLVGFGERRQVEEVVLGLLEARGFAVNLGDGVDELVRVELVAAGVALVAAGTVAPQIGQVPSM